MKIAYAVLILVLGGSPILGGSAFAQMPGMDGGMGGPNGGGPGGGGMSGGRDATMGGQMGEQGAGRFAACREDVQKFCADQTGRERRSCLMDNADKVSAACRAVLTERSGAGGN